MKRFNIIIDPLFSNLADKMVDVATNGLPPNAIAVYRGKRNSLDCIPKVKPPINVKTFRIPSFPNNLFYGWLRKSQARRSYENAQRLRSLGFLSPAPMGYIEELSPLRFGRSFYFSEHQMGPTVADILRSPQMRDILPDLGREMARMFDAGVWMKDFSPANMIVCFDSDTPTFSHVDLNSIQFGVRSRSKLMRMFRNICPDRELAAELGRCFARAHGDNPEKMAAFAAEQHDKYLDSNFFKPNRV